MLNVSLDKLQEATLGARSATAEEASLRTKEAELIGKFIERARNIQPKGQVILNAKKIWKARYWKTGTLSRFQKKTSLVMIHGEVLFPNAVNWQSGNDIDGYIKQVGGYSQDPDKARIIVMRQNGESIPAKSSTIVGAGDEIMVLPNIDSKKISKSHVALHKSCTRLQWQQKVVFGL
ncbi:hypothetical protein ACFS07_07485 [Undibacterium arcticum]